MNYSDIDNSQKRNSVIDVCKGIGILLVVIGHLGTVWGGIIYHFHMALFFLLSGWCFSTSYLDAKWLFVKKRMISLLWPVLFFRLFSKIIGYFFPTYESFEEDYHLLGTLWFLEWLFFASFITLFILYYLRKVTSRYYILVGFIIMLALSFVFSLFDLLDINLSNIGSRCYVTVFYILGIGLKNNEKSINNLMNLSPFNKLLICLISLWSLIFLSEIVKVPVITECDYRSFIPYGLSSLAGILLVFYSSYLIKSLFMNNLLIIVGQNTMPILLLQWSSFAIVDFLMISGCISLGADILFYFKLLSGVLIPLMIQYIYNHLPWLHLNRFLNC